MSCTYNQRQVACRVLATVCAGGEFFAELRGCCQSLTWHSISSVAGAFKGHSDRCICFRPLVIKADGFLLRLGSSSSSAPSSYFPLSARQKRQLVCRLLRVIVPKFSRSPGCLQSSREILPCDADGMIRRLHVYISTATWAWLGPLSAGQCVAVVPAWLVAAGSNAFTQLGQRWPSGSIPRCMTSFDELGQANCGSAFRERQRGSLTAGKCERR